MPSALFESRRLICPLAKVKRKFIVSISAQLPVELSGLKYWRTSLSGFGLSAGSAPLIIALVHAQIIHLSTSGHKRTPPRPSGVRVSVCVQRASPLAPVQTNYLGGTLAE